MTRHESVVAVGKIEISAVHGRWLIVKVPPPAVEPAPAEAVTLTSARSRCGETGNRTDTQEQVEGRCRASGIDQWSGGTKLIEWALLRNPDRPAGFDDSATPHDFCVAFEDAALLSTWTCIHLNIKLCSWRFINDL